MKGDRSDRKKLLKEAKRLIRFRSVTTESNGAIACYVGRLLKKEHFRVRYQTERIGGIPFSNVLGVKGRGKRPLILMTHLDTVPPGPLPLWTKTGKNPWNPVVEGEKIYGLGSADTKLDILSKIFASHGIPAELMKHPLWIVGTFGEERGLLGARVFCKRIKRLGGYAFVSEPSELTWVHEHRGYLVLELSIPLDSVSRRVLPGQMFELEVTGKSAHSSTPQKGRNAIRLAFDFLEKVSREDPLLTLLFVEGGSSPNQVPPLARLMCSTSLKTLPSHPFVKIHKLTKITRPYGTIPWGTLLALFDAVDHGVRFRRYPMTSNVGVIQIKKRSLKVLVDFRIHPEDKNREVFLFFKRLMKKVLGRRKLHASFRIERDGPPLSVSPKSPIVRLAREVSRSVGEPFRLAKKPSCTEAGYLGEAGIPALVFGPGRSAGNIHAPNEYNELRQLERTKRLYKALIQRYCLRD